jgi:hypothetical protein
MYDVDELIMELVSAPQEKKEMMRKIWKVINEG